MAIIHHHYNINLRRPLDLTSKYEQFLSDKVKPVFYLTSSEPDYHHQPCSMKKLDNSLLYFLITQICVKVNCSIYAVNFYTNLCKAKHFGPCRQAGAKCKGPDSFPQLQTSRGSSLFSNPIGHSMAQEAISATHRLTVKNSIV